MDNEDKLREIYSQAIRYKKKAEDKDMLIHDLNIIEGLCKDVLLGVKE